MVKDKSVQMVVRIGFLSAVGLVLTFFEFPILPSAPFLKYDASEVPALIAAFGMGPLAGFLTVFLKSLLFHFSGKNMTGIVGTSAMIVAGTALVVPAGIVYARMKNIRGAVLGLLSGIVGITVIMFFANLYVLLPLWGIPEEIRASLVRSAVVPFNIIKGFTSSIVTFLLYKRVSSIVRLDKPIV